MQNDSGLRLAPPAAVLASFLVLCACATPAPPRDAAVAVVVPESWANEPAALGAFDRAPLADPTALAQWWARFDDALLTQLVQTAVTANPDVTSAQAALREAWALRDVSEAELRPRLDGVASAQRSRVGGSAGRSNNNFRVGLDATWDPDVFGVNRSALRTSQATALARDAALGDVQVSTAATVALAYINLRGNQARLVIASDSLAGQRETLQLTEWRVQAGLLSTLEAEQARAAAEQTAAQVPALQGAIEQGAHALSVLTGQVPGTLRDQLAAARALPQPADDLVLAVPAQTLRQRADVRAAEYRVSAALARLAGAEAAGLPNFRLSGDLALSALTLGALGSSAALAGSLLAGLRLPMFDGGATRAQARAQHAALEQAEVAYRATVLKALKEVEDALVALRSDRERLARLGNAAAAAGNAALLANQRYGSGLVDFQTVLETQRTQRVSQDAVVAAATDVSADHVRLYIALGGGWSDGRTGERNQNRALSSSLGTPKP